MPHVVGLPAAQLGVENLQLRRGADSRRAVALGARARARRHPRQGGLVGWLVGAAVENG